MGFILLYVYSSWGDHEYGWIYYILVLVAGNLRILFTASLTWIWARACDRKNCLFAFAKTCLHFYGMNDHNDIEQLDIPYLSFHSSGIIARLVESSSPIERRPVNPSVVWLCERVLGSSTGKYHQRCSTALYTVYTVYTVATRFQKFHFYQIWAAVHCLNSSMHAYIYCWRRFELYWKGNRAPVVLIWCNEY